jgi:CDP-diacylglycerol--serine O-phosphatidyltransferase
MDHKKFVFFLPNSFTALNMACGFAGIMYAVQGSFYQAGLWILVGALFDSVDGRVARYTGTQSAFGEQFDSLSDLVSFGISPAMLYYFCFLKPYGRLGYVAAFLFMLCGALRLARFNANIDRVKSDYFQGLPIPGAATAIVSAVMLSLRYPDWAAYLSFAPVIYILIYAALMISSVPFPSFKNSPWMKRNKKQVLMLIFVICCLFFIFEEVAVASLITVYVLFSIAYVLLNKEKFHGVFDWSNEKDLVEDD